MASKLHSTPLILTVLLAVLGWWYWTTRPAHVQAAITTIRDGSNINETMTVESISEGDETLAGRHVTIAKARVTHVAGPRTFWVTGDEGDPLLIVLDASAKPPASVGPGKRVSVIGVVRNQADTQSLPARDQAEVMKSGLHVVATDVRQAGQLR